MMMSDNPMGYKPSDLEKLLSEAQFPAHWPKWGTDVYTGSAFSIKHASKFECKAIPDPVSVTEALS